MSESNNKGWIGKLLTFLFVIALLLLVAFFVWQYVANKNKLSERDEELIEACIALQNYGGTTVACTALKQSGALNPTPTPAPTTNP